MNMNFLKFELTDIPEMIVNAGRAFCGMLCEFIYPLIGKLYQIFVNMGTLFVNDNFSEIYNKISLIIGVFMVFRVTFWLIELLLSPDKITDKEKSPTKIVQKVLVSVVLLAITPTVFKYAFNLQYEILVDNTIGKIFAISDSGKNVTEPDEAGKFLAAELFSNFLSPSDYIESGDNCYTFANGVKNQLLITDELEITNSCLAEKTNGVVNGEKQYLIDFNGFFAVGVGSFVLWMILMYCISVGTRYVQLIYLQVIAPVPIMCYLTPNKDNMLSKWFKQCTTTYLDLFIRIAIINLVILLTDVIFSYDFLTIPDMEDGWIIQVFLILGLLTFAKKAPELIQELLPKSLAKASGDFGLSWKKRTDSMLGGKFIYGVSNPKRAIGFTAGGLAGALTGGVMGAAGGKGVGSRLVGGLTGAYRGFTTGSKKGSVIKNVKEAKKNQAAQNNRLQQWRINAGKGENEPNTFGDWMSRRDDAFKKSLGFETEGDYFERGKSSSKLAIDAYQNGKKNSINKAIEKQTKAKAFGYDDITLTQLDQKRKSAQQALDANDKSILLFDEDGQKRLKNFYVNNGGSASSFDRLSLEQKDKVANTFVKYLQQQSDEANESYNSKEKEFGFIYQIEQAFGIERDDDGIIMTNTDGSLSSSGSSEEYKNYFKSINDFVSEYDEMFNITSGEDAIFKTKIKYTDVDGTIHETDVPVEFDYKKMAMLMADAESDSDTSLESQVKLKAIYKNWDMIKTLQSRVDTVGSKPKHLYDQANNKFNK